MWHRGLGVKSMSGGGGGVGQSLDEAVKLKSSQYISNLTNAKCGGPI